jgi:mannosyltransferase OCH1-like enzyme
MIPKKAYVSWVNKDIVSSKSLIIEHGLRNLIELNPDWEVSLYDNDEVVQYLRDNLEESVFKLFEGAHIVEKLDTWRLIKLYQEGGMYVDLDRLCNVRLSDVIPDHIKCVLPTSRDFDFSHDLMVTEAGNPIFKTAVELQLQRRWEGSRNVYFLGPQTYIHAITKTLTGKMINTNPGKEVMDALRQEILKTGFLDTYTEDYPFDTFLFRKSDVRFDHEAEKRKLYAEQKLKHWTNEW